MIGCTHLHPCCPLNPAHFCGQNGGFLRSYISRCVSDCSIGSSWELVQKCRHSEFTSGDWALLSNSPTLQCHEANGGSEAKMTVINTCCPVRTVSSTPSPAHTGGSGFWNRYDLDRKVKVLWAAVFCHLVRMPVHSHFWVFIEDYGFSGWTPREQAPGLWTMEIPWGARGIQTQQLILVSMVTLAQEIKAL